MLEYSILTSICLPITITGARYVTKVLHEYIVVSIVTWGKASIETSQSLIQPSVVILFSESSCVSWNNRIYLGSVNTKVDYKPILKCLLCGRERGWRFCVTNPYIPYDPHSVNGLNQIHSAFCWEGQGPKHRQCAASPLKHKISN
jgi:hypothetical protein